MFVFCYWIWLVLVLPAAHAWHHGGNWIGMSRRVLATNYNIIQMSNRHLLYKSNLFSGMETSTVSLERFVEEKIENDVTKASIALTTSFDERFKRRLGEMNSKFEDLMSDMNSKFAEVKSAIGTLSGQIQHQHEFFVRGTSVLLMVLMALVLL